MTFITKFYAVIILLFFMVTAANSIDSDNPKSIGFYTAGCIQNSQELEEETAVLESVLVKLRRI